MTLDFLARFLGKVADHEKKNRMNAKGLAVVLSPNLLRNPEGDPLIFKVRAVDDQESTFRRTLPLADMFCGPWHLTRDTSSQHSIRFSSEDYFARTKTRPLVLSSCFCMTHRRTRMLRPFS